jgi:hypothetical protein
MDETQEVLYFLDFDRHFWIAVYFVELWSWKQYGFHREWQFSHSFQVVFFSAGVE